MQGHWKPDQAWDKIIWALLSISKKKEERFNETYSPTLFRILEAEKKNSTRYHGVKLFLNTLEVVGPLCRFWARDNLSPFSHPFSLFSAFHKFSGHLRNSQYILQIHYAFHKFLVHFTNSWWISECFGAFHKFSVHFKNSWYILQIYSEFHKFTVHFTNSQCISLILRAFH